MLNTMKGDCAYLGTGTVWEGMKSVGKKEEESCWQLQLRAVDEESRIAQGMQWNSKDQV